MEAKLTFYPITKNIIFLSNQLVISILNNLDLYFDNSEYIKYYEKEFFAERGINVYPWLWSKTPSRTKETHTGWELYFDMWNKQKITLTNNLFMNVCLCSNEIFKPNARIQNIINQEIKKIVFKHKRMISIHFRRGDAEKASQNKNMVFEKVISTSNIIEIIKQNKFLDYDIYISSEDKTIINELKQQLPQYNFINSEYLLDKEVVFSDNNHIDIESFCYNNTKYIEDIVISAIIDLFFFQRSNIIIGPIFLSAFTYCGYILSCGYNKKQVTFIDPTTSRTDVENISLI
jgi:hypothetical protein